MGGHGYAYAEGCCQSKTKLSQATLNRWYHVCGVFDGSNGKIQIYVNGIMENASTVTGGQYPMQFTANS